LPWADVHRRFQRRNADRRSFSRRGKKTNHLGTSAEFWLGLQSDYDLEKAQEEFAERIEREVQPRERAA